MLMGSYVAGVAFGDGATMLDFTDRGLRADPEDAMLINNKIVALAYLGRLDESIDLLEELVIERTAPIAQATLYATAGLLSFRAGHPERGREFYERALSHPYTRQDLGVRILALWHLAIEEVHARTNHAEGAISRAERASKDVKLAEIPALRARVEVAKADATTSESTTATAVSAQSRSRQ
jgi:tetratricopeptide (TPR) repeat protein